MKKHADAYFRPKFDAAKGLTVEEPALRPAERKERVGDIIDRFQIVGKKDLYPKQLSGGQQQLVAVARATITRPKVLLADEPTGALHTSQGEMIMDLLGELNRDGATIVMVTHSEANATRAQRRIALLDGWISEAR